MSHPRGRADVNECPLCISSVSLPQKWNCVGRIVTKKKVGPLMVIRTTQMLVQCVAVLERVYVWGFIIINPFFRVVHVLYVVCVCCPKEIGNIWEESWKQKWDILQCVTCLPAWTAIFTQRYVHACRYTSRVFIFFFSTKKPTKITVYLYIIKCVLRYTVFFVRSDLEKFRNNCFLYSVKYLITIITWLTWLWEYNTRTHEQEENLQVTHGKPEHCVSSTIRLSVKVGTLRSSLPGSN